MAPAKRTTVPMKREYVMQGSWSIAVDEKRPSLAVDDAVLVGAPAWWRTVAMDVVVAGGYGCDGGALRWLSVVLQIERGREPERVERRDRGRG